MGDIHLCPVLVALNISRLDTHAAVVPETLREPYICSAPINSPRIRMNSETGIGEALKVSSDFRKQPFLLKIQHLPVYTVGAVETKMVPGF